MDISLRFQHPAEALEPHALTLEHARSDLQRQTQGANSVMGWLGSHFDGIDEAAMQREAEAALRRSEITGGFSAEDEQIFEAWLHEARTDVTHVQNFGINLAIGATAAFIATLAAPVTIAALGLAGIAGATAAIVSVLAGTAVGGVVGTNIGARLYQEQENAAQWLGNQAETFEVLGTWDQRMLSARTTAFVGAFSAAAAPYVLGGMATKIGGQTAQSWQRALIASKGNIAVAMHAMPWAMRTGAAAVTDLAVNSSIGTAEALHAGYSLPEALLYGTLQGGTTAAFGTGFNIVGDMVGVAVGRLIGDIALPHIQRIANTANSYAKKLNIEQLFSAINNKLLGIDTSHNLLLETGSQNLTPAPIKSIENHVLRMAVQSDSGGSNPALIDQLILSIYKNFDPQTADRAIRGFRDKTYRPEQLIEAGAYAHLLPTHIGDRPVVGVMREIFTQGQEFPQVVVNALTESFLITRRILSPDEAIHNYAKWFAENGLYTQLHIEPYATQMIIPTPKIGDAAYGGIYGLMSENFTGSRGGRPLHFILRHTASELRIGIDYIQRDPALLMAAMAAYKTELMIADEVLNAMRPALLYADIRQRGFPIPSMSESYAALLSVNYNYLLRAKDAAKMYFGEIDSNKTFAMPYFVHVANALAESGRSPKKMRTITPELFQLGVARMIGSEDFIATATPHTPGAEHTHFNIRQMCPGMEAALSTGPTPETNFQGGLVYFFYNRIRNDLASGDQRAAQFAAGTVKAIANNIENVGLKF